MRLTLDTNVAVSGLIEQGTFGRTIDAGLAKKFQFLSNVSLLAELEGVLQRPTFQQAIRKHSQGETPYHSNPPRVPLPSQVAFIQPFDCSS